jgi:hypothetical protein
MFLCSNFLPVAITSQGGKSPPSAASSPYNENGPIYPDAASRLLELPKANEK